MRVVGLASGVVAQALVRFVHGVPGVGRATVRVDAGPVIRTSVGTRAPNEAVERKLVQIWNLNAGRIGTGDPNLIFPGARLRLP